MNPTIKEDIISVLDSSLVFINDTDYSKLKELSNHVIHNASIYQDQYSINIAILIYAISKIFDRDKDLNPKVIRLLKDLKQTLLNDRYKDYETDVKQLYKTIAKEDSKLRLYINEVIEMAQIKKGSKIYDHGISMAQSAEILGISQWELMDYIGKTRISDTFEENGDIVNKLEFVRKIFNINKQ